LLRKEYNQSHNWIDAYDCNGQVLLGMEDDCTGSQGTQWTVVLEEEEEDDGGEEEEEAKRRRKRRK
jgi:hypothetical protein